MRTEDLDGMTFSEYLDGLNTTDYELAKAVGVDRSTIHNYRHGKRQYPNWDIMRKLADHFGMESSTVYAMIRREVESE